MAYFPGNFLFGRTTKLNYRVFLIPWAQGNNCLSSGKDRHYASSVPVKYIPKKSSTSKENEAAHLGVKEEHNGLQMNTSRIHLLKNSQHSYSDTESKNHASLQSLNLRGEVDEEMEVDFTGLNDEFSEDYDDQFVVNSTKSGQGIQNGKSKQEVEKAVIEALAVRAFTAVELKKKLQRKRFPPDLIDAVITDFQSRGMINDCLYAETFSQSRWRSSSWGPQRIKQALLKKGVNEVDIESAIKQVFEDEAGGDRDSGIAMSKVSMDQLYVQASKQWLRSSNVPEEKRKSRLVRWLQYRGFSWSIIKCVLSKLEHKRDT